MANLFWKSKSGSGPIIAVANHHGHDLRPDVEEIMNLSDLARLQEEDPFTGEWAALVPTHLIAQHSRFEVDLNRPRDNAVYLRPEDAWGLQVWKTTPSQRIIEQSLSDYDDYYAVLDSLCREKEQAYANFAVLDLHSYNHRREGPDEPEADPAGNPEVNIGTGTMDRDRWGNLVDRFMDELSCYNFLGRRLDVRENVKFVGRQFPKWVHTHYPNSGCAIAIEFKKFFMNEWTGTLDMQANEEIKRALASTLPGIEEELQKVIPSL